MTVPLTYTHQKQAFFFVWGGTRSGEGIVPISILFHNSQSDPVKNLSHTPWPSFAEHPQQHPLTQRYSNSSPFNGPSQPCPQPHHFPAPYPTPHISCQISHSPLSALPAGSLTGYSPTSSKFLACPFHSLGLGLHRAHTLTSPKFCSSIKTRLP